MKDPFKSSLTTIGRFLSYPTAGWIFVFPAAIMAHVTLATQNMRDYLDILLPAAILSTIACLIGVISFIRGSLFDRIHAVILAAVALMILNESLGRFRSISTNFP